MFTIIVLLLFFETLSIGLCCDLIETKVDFQLLGEGFHRTLKLETNFSSSSRLVECRLAYLFQIPHGAFVNVDELNLMSSILKHCYVSSPFDTEAPQGSKKVPQFQPIFWYSNQTFRNVFLFQDVISFPVHLRYHRPIGKDGNIIYNQFILATYKNQKILELKVYNKIIDETPTNIVEFDLPQIFVRCKQNKTILAVQSCLKNVEKIPCGCNGQNPKCAFNRLSPQPPTRLKTVVPVGNQDHALLITIVSLFVVFSCLCYIVYTVISTPKTKTKTKTQ